MKFTPDDNQRCTVCGKSGPEKACTLCVAKYGRQYDLSTPDGRYQARVAEQGSPLEQQRRLVEAYELKSQAARSKQQPMIEKLTVKLARARVALDAGQHNELVEALKGAERLSKKIRECD